MLVEEMQSDAGLDVDQGDVVGQDVVEILRQRQALRVPPALLVLLLGPGPLGGIRPADAHQLRHGQHAHQPAPDQREVQEPLIGV
jgi:hypothetical protein